MFSLDGKTVIVCGGAGFLGLPVCNELAKLGANVTIADIDDDALDKAVSQISKITSAVVGIKFDVGDEESINQLIEKTIAHFKTDLYALVVATFKRSSIPFDKITPSEFDHALHINVTGTFMLARKAAGRMINGGSIVLYTSIYGCVAPFLELYESPMLPNPVEYGASKAAIIQLTKYLAAYYGPNKIRVNAIMPGPFPHMADKEFILKLADRTMLKRIGNRNETAGPVAFLISDASTYVTGHVLTVDGGWTAW